MAPNETRVLVLVDKPTIIHQPTTVFAAHAARAASIPQITTRQREPLLLSLLLLPIRIIGALIIIAVILAAIH